MEKNRSSQIIAMIGLGIGIIGLSIGFAAFSKVLNIQSSANVKPNNSTTNVDFSSAEDKVEIAEITPTSTPNTVTATMQWKDVKLSQTSRKLVNEYRTTSSKMDTTIQKL